MPPKSPVDFADVVIFADRYLAQIEAIERADFQRLGLNPDDATGILRVKDIMAAFGCSRSYSQHLLRELLLTSSGKYERIHLGSQRWGLTRKR